MTAQPLLRSLRLAAQALHREPELRRVVRNCEMNGLVRDEVAEYEVRREDEAPVEGEIPLRRAVPPLGSLSHHVHTVRLLSQAHRDHGQVPLDLPPRLLAKPVLQAPCHWRT